MCPVCTCHIIHVKVRGQLLGPDAILALTLTQDHISLSIWSLHPNFTKFGTAIPQFSCNYNWAGGLQSLRTVIGNMFFNSVSWLPRMYQNWGSGVITPLCSSDQMTPGKTRTNPPGSKTTNQIEKAFVILLYQIELWSFNSLKGGHWAKYNSKYLYFNTQ